MLYLTDKTSLYAGSCARLMRKIPKEMLTASALTHWLKFEFGALEGPTGAVKYPHLLSPGSMVLTLNDLGIMAKWGWGGGSFRPSLGYKVAW